MLGERGGGTNSLALPGRMVYQTLTVIRSESVHERERRGPALGQVNSTGARRHWSLIRSLTTHGAVCQSKRGEDSQCVPVAGRGRGARMVVAVADRRRREPLLKSRAWKIIWKLSLTWRRISNTKRFLLHHRLWRCGQIVWYRPRCDARRSL